MGTTVENRISSVEAKDAIYKASQINSSASEIDDSVNNALPKGGMGVKEPSMSGHLLFVPTSPNTAYREHKEPSGWISSGTTSKSDLMFDPYDVSQADYRIFNMFTKHNTDGALHTCGTSCLSTKGSGHFFGVFPSLQIGHQDCSQTATPMTLYYFDTSDTEWRSGQQGIWREGKPIEINKYLQYGGRLYKCLTSGVCTGTPPTHTTGIINNLEFIRDYNITSNAFRPTVIIGDRDDLPLFNFPDVRLQLAKDVLLKYARKIHFIDQNGIKTSVQASANKTVSVLDENGIPVLIIDMVQQRFDFKKKILIREGIQDKTGSTGTIGQVLVANGDGTCQWKTI